MPDDDDLADKYQLADERLAAAGFGWYEVSNWARATGAAGAGTTSLYWTGGDWWGVGPGAHTHVGGVRWWNVKHPAAYADRLAAGRQPGARARGARRRDPAGRAGAAGGAAARGAAASTVLDAAGRAAVARPGRATACVEPARASRLVLTPRGRLLADAVVRDLLP